MQARLFRLAANQGFAPALCGLGLMYKDGRGVAQDLATANALFRQAKSHGFPEPHACVLDA